MPIMQERNAEMQQLNSADLLSSKDKNLCAEWYNSVNSASFFSETVVEFDTAYHNFFADWFTVTTGVLTLHRGGFYRIEYSLNIQHTGSGESPYQARMQVNTGAGWAEIPQTLSQVTSFIGATTLQNAITVRAEPSWTYRVTVNANVTSGVVTALRSRLGVLCLFETG